MKPLCRAALPALVLALALAQAAPALAHGPAARAALDSYALGLKQRNGVGMARDLGAARRSLGQAAEDGLPAAMFMLAQMLEAGEGGARDADGARAWIARAAQLEYPEALQEQALRERDPQRAAELLREAAHALQHRARENRGPGW